LINNLHLEKRVRIFTPVTQEQLRKIYNKAAIVILNSVDEGFGLALTEAMLCRRAVIGTDSGGITDIIDENETGLLVSEDNPEELAMAIRQLINNPQLRRILGEAGYQKAIREFSSRATAGRYADLYKYKVE
jgi:glycosyltransferase involved in cell wall biosynthesis